ncbi:hypothetical protein Ait01nite_021410 [Actinoplanes italicus]|uniref:Uncharacterized protein n=1 Tax=Actinoplanes italicus TaxID=113567 RepID=A0A2T0KNZ3_9ACTN|nr:hypothetical protein [Actinoplanes italicus]PRX25463.1 hypothetical protein CLV67_101178 [Actinoplanes italicus]GIE29096.1 hypothetical protein Ait01nite_021410 [Actinoplanes italicus]
MAERPQPDLGSVLRHEAERHVADRDAMLTRIVQRRSEPARGRWTLTLRPVAAAASVVATLVAGFAGIRLVGDRPEPERTPAATEGSSASTPSATATPSPSGRTPLDKGDGGVRKPDPPAPGNTAVTPGWQPVNGFLSSVAVVDGHSVGTWAQGNVTLTASETISALEVVINVAKSAGVKDAGRWSTVPETMITSTVTEEKNRLVYRFSLKQGTLAPGSYVFAAQYQHAAGERDPATDTYGALATAGTRRVTVTGAFPAR